MSDKFKALEYSKKNFSNYQVILQDFVKIHSISTDSNRKKDMVQAAEFLLSFSLKSFLKKIEREKRLFGTLTRSGLS